jgi:ubiquinone/menaquinone biosynthesis C-methylase UbiE
MTDHKTIYQQEAERYDHLVMREDKDSNLLPAIQSILPLAGIDAVELGAGSGRLSTMMAPLVRSLHAFDASAAMLAVAESKLRALGLSNWQTQLADHRRIPLPDDCADLVISGWSICYLNDNERADWQTPFAEALVEMKRLLRPAGTILIIETEGTGVSTPQPPDSMQRYLAWLREQGFAFDWVRTDYRFTSWEEARALVPFFFGDAMLSACFEEGSSVILPECTGLWHWRASA